MAGRGDQAVFTIEGILTGFFGGVKSMPPNSHDSLLILRIAFPYFFFVVGIAIRMELVK